MLIVANWKAYVETLAKANRLLAAAGHHDIVIAPSAPHLGFLAGSNRSSVEFAAQDVSAEETGAATGEVTAGLLADLGVAYVIVGHSERRAQGESDATVLEKAKHALAHGLIPILCIGERTRDAEASYLAFLRAQLTALLSPLSPRERARLVVAYEPIWAIGKSAEDSITPADLTEMVLYIRKVLSEFIPGKASLKVKILYGGSVEPGNARVLAASSGIEGFLVGHASVDVASFGAIVKAVT